MIKECSKTKETSFCFRSFSPRLLCFSVPSDVNAVSLRIRKQNLHPFCRFNHTKEAYVPHNKEWLKERVYQMMLKSAAQ